MACAENVKAELRHKEHNKGRKEKRGGEVIKELKCRDFKREAEIEEIER